MIEIDYFLRATRNLVIRIQDYILEEYLDEVESDILDLMVLMYHKGIEDAIGRSREIEVQRDTEANLN